MQKEHSYKIASEHFSKLNKIIFNNENTDQHQEFLIKTLEELIYLETILDKNCTIKPKIKLPKRLSNKKKTLFIDLDETLVFYDENKRADDNTAFTLRPYAKEFIKEISKTYEIFIYTAGNEEYAEFIADMIDPEQNLIDAILDRTSCLKTKNGLLIKDLHIIKNRKFSDMVLVDNSSISFGKLIENGIPILSFTGDKNDKELVFLLEFLKEISKFSDIREGIKTRYDLKRILQEFVN